MDQLANYSKEQRLELTKAIRNNDAATFKNIIGYDSMSYSDKITSMVFYQDMVDTFKSVRESHTNNGNNSSGVEVSGEDKSILDMVTRVVSSKLGK